MTRLIDADVVIKNIEEYWEMVKRGKPSRGMTAVMQSIKTIVNSLQTVDAEPHWIPCSERLPEDDRSKVVTLANGNAEVGYYSNGDWWCVGDKFTLENPTVIAWMPLPKPYEVEDERD